MDESCGVGFHQFDAGTQCIGHVHHIHIGAGAQRASEVPRTYSGIVDIYSVVGSATSWRGYIRYKAWEADGAGVDAEALLVVIAQELARDLRHTIHRLGALDGILWCQIMRGLRAEGADGAGGEDSATRLTCYLKDIEESTYPDMPR